MKTIITPLPNANYFCGTPQQYLESIRPYFSKFQEYVEKWKRIIIPFALHLWIDNQGAAYNPDWTNDMRHIFSDSAFHDQVLIHHNISGLENPEFISFLQESWSLYLPRNPQKRPTIPVDVYPSLQGLASADKSQEVIVLTRALDVLLSTCYDLNSSLFPPLSEEILHPEANMIQPKIPEKATSLPKKNPHKPKPRKPLPLPPPVQHPQLSEVLKLHPISIRRPIQRDTITFVDVGAGKGYFSIFVSAELHLRVLAIEASLAHSKHLRNRMTKLISQRRSKMDDFQCISFCIGLASSRTAIESIAARSTQCSDFLEAAKRFDDSANRDKTRSHRNIQGELATEILPDPTDQNNIQSKGFENSEFFSMGLHACGDLSIFTHEMMLNSSKALGALSVPCCYQHLSSNKFPLLPENHQIFTELFATPLLRHTLLNYAVSDYDRGLDWHLSAISGYITRSVLEFFIPRGLSIKSHPARNESEIDYLMRAIKDVYSNLDFTSDPSIGVSEGSNENISENNNNQEENESYEDGYHRYGSLQEQCEKNPILGEIAAGMDEGELRKRVEERVRLCREEEWKMWTHVIIRETFGHALESFLLLERLAYFGQLVDEKQGSYLLGLFDLFCDISPRGFSIFTLKLD